MKELMFEKSSEHRSKSCIAVYEREQRRGWETAKESNHTGASKRLTGGSVGRMPRLSQTSVHSFSKHEPKHAAGN